LPRFVSVAVPVPFLDLLTYRVPDDMALPLRGARLVVPLGRRVVTGIAVGPAEVPGDRAIKNIVAVLDADAFLPPAVVELALWVAGYYACGAGDALAAAMPPVRAAKMVRTVSLTAQGHEPDLKLTPRQREAIGLLLGAPAAASQSMSSSD